MIGTQKRSQQLSMGHVFGKAAKPIGTCRLPQIFKVVIIGGIVPSLVFFSSNCLENVFSITCLGHISFPQLFRVDRKFHPGVCGPEGIRVFEPM